MPNDSNENESIDNQNISEVNINLDACEKYGISLSEPPVEPVEPYSRYLSDDTVYGFVTEVSHDNDGTEIEIKDWGYCLEENRIELGFENMSRSQIMEEVIKSYGLVPLVDLSGLADDVISWDNKSSKPSSNTGGGGNLTGESSGSASIDEAVQNAVKGKTDPLEKAKAIDKSFKDHVYYRKYYGAKYPNDLEKAWQDAHLNCGDGANILCAMFIKAGFKAVIVFVPGHYIVKVNVNGKTYYTDNGWTEGQLSKRPFGEVWRGITSGSEIGTRVGK